LFYLKTNLNKDRSKDVDANGNLIFDSLTFEILRIYIYFKNTLKKVLLIYSDILENLSAKNNVEYMHLNKRIYHHVM
jgi:hypothetical protein